MPDILDQEIKIIIRVFKVPSKTKEIEHLLRRSINFEFLHNQSIELQQ